MRAATLGVHDAGRRRARRRRRRARRPPLVLIGLDLGRVGLEVLDIDAQPLLCRVAARLGVGARTLPPVLGQPPDQRVRVRAQRLDDRQGRLGGQRVVVDRLGPAVLVERADHRVHLGHQEADPRVAVGLGVRAVAENFVGRPGPRAGTPGPRRRREVAPRRGDLVRPGGEAVEQAWRSDDVSMPQYRMPSRHAVPELLRGAPAVAARSGRGPGPINVRSRQGRDLERGPDVETARPRRP